VAATIDAAGADVAFVAVLNAAEPGGGAAVPGANVEIVAVADNPDRHRLPQRFVVSCGRDLQLICCFDPVQLFARPRSHHGFTMTLIASRSLIAR
jgi:hypothetical protein